MSLWCWSSGPTALHVFNVSLPHHTRLQLNLADLYNNPSDDVWMMIPCLNTLNQCVEAGNHLKHAELQNLRTLENLTAFHFSNWSAFFFPWGPSVNAMRTEDLDLCHEVVWYLRVQRTISQDWYVQSMIMIQNLQFRVTTYIFKKGLYLEIP